MSVLGIITQFATTAMNNTAKSDLAKQEYEYNKQLQEAKLQSEHENALKEQSERLAVMHRNAIEESNVRHEHDKALENLKLRNTVSALGVQQSNAVQLKQMDINSAIALEDTKASNRVGTSYLTFPLSLGVGVAGGVAAGFAKSYFHNKFNNHNNNKPNGGATSNDEFWDSVSKKYQDMKREGNSNSNVLLNFQGEPIKVGSLDRGPSELSKMKSLDERLQVGNPAHYAIPVLGVTNLSIPVTL